MPDPFVPSLFNDFSIGFNDPLMGFNGTPGPPALPVILTIAPGSGPASGGTAVTLTGTGFLSGTVIVDGALVTPDSNTDFQIVFTTPAHAAGTVSVAVDTSAGTSNLVSFTYTSIGPPAAPTVSKLDPAAGPVSGGSIVIITGTEFGFATAVFFGDAPAAEFAIDSDTQITARTPAHAAGPVPVTVTNPSGTSGITPACVFTFFPPRPPKTRRWTILARDANNRPQAEISDYTALTFIERDKAVGSHLLTVPADSPFVAALDAPRAGIIVLEDDQEVFSGPILGRIRSSKGGLETFTVYGADDNVWLAARHANREPATEAPPYNHQLYDTRTGLASSVISQYVDVNLGQSAISRRRLPNLSIGEDLGLGSTVTGQAGAQILLDLLRQLALASHPEISFRARQSGGALVFNTFVPRDLTSKAVFSAATGTLGDFEYEQAASKSNYIYAAGKGSGTGRLIVEGENGIDIAEWGLFESVLARADLTTEADLLQAITFELRAESGVFRLDLSIVDTAGLEWRVDWNTGDRVGVIVDGVKLEEVVRETKVELGRDGGDDTEKITPSVSSPNPRTTVREQALFSLVRDLQGRVLDLERNQ